VNLAIFDLAGKLFACPSNAIDAVIDASRSVTFDMGPSWVDGIVELSGRQVLVLDISKILKIKSNATESLLAIDVNSEQVCIKVDKFIGYMDIPGNTNAKGVSGDIGTLSGVLVGIFHLDHKKYHLLNFAQLTNTQIFTGSHI